MANQTISIIIVWVITKLTKLFLIALSFSSKRHNKFPIQGGNQSQKKAWNYFSLGSLSIASTSIFILSPKPLSIIYTLWSFSCLIFHLFFGSMTKYSIPDTFQDMVRLIMITTRKGHLLATFKCSSCRMRHRQGLSPVGAGQVHLVEVHTLVR